MGGQFQIWIQLQIHVWFVLYDLNFHCIDIMLTLWYLQNSIFCSIALFQVVRFEIFLHNQGLFFQMTILSTTNPMLSSKLNALSHNSVPSGQNSQIHSQTELVFFQTIVLSTNNPMLSSKLNISFQISVHLNIICSMSTYDIFCVFHMQF